MELKVINAVVVCLTCLISWQYQVYGCKKQRRSNQPRPRNCKLTSWYSWGSCNHPCGYAGVRKRTRYKIVTECCGGYCGQLVEYEPCNRDECQNYGTPAYASCNCRAGWTGTCCEYDKDECSTDRPCQHNCHNTLGSYTCSCYSCYTKRGKRCTLDKCKIGGRCFEYGEVNPKNQCQDCQKSRKRTWTNNNALSCSDYNLCTRNDKCMNGACVGTPFTCRDCERCDGSGCRIKPGYCVINGKCYGHGDLRPGKPCQQCNSNNPTRWTSNNNLKCNDNNVKTRNDRCRNGECSGQPFTCLTCEDHYNDACRLKSGYCIIKYNNVQTCFVANTEKPGNPCQWCLPKKSRTTWTLKHNVLCDDGESCTKSDKCVHGQCQGISFTCDRDCQYCNGQNCSLHPGYGYVGKKCTCKIGGKDYNHQQLNPRNECQWCDIYDPTSKPIFTWSNRPAVTCNDDNACTMQDICRNGQCVGKEYTCQASYSLSSCIQRSQCMGDGTCKDIMKANGTLCRAAVDQCDEPERCNGVMGTCPQKYVTAIKLQEGQVRLTHSNYERPVAFHSSTDTLYLQLEGFSVSCGSLVLNWSLIKADDKCLLGISNATLSPYTKNHILTSLNLKNTETYKVVVQASNTRKQLGLPVCGNPVTIDTTKPTNGWVKDGLGSNDIQYQSRKALSASWGGFQTAYGVAKYEVAVYFQPPSANVKIKLYGFANFNLTVSYTKTFSKITDGSNVTTKVRAYTKAGLYSEIESDGVTVDTSTPLAGYVSDGSSISSNLEYASWLSTYDVSWEPFKDKHTPIVDYKVGVKRKNGAFVSSKLISVGLKYKFLVSGLTLVSGEEYCAIVQGINAAGLQTQASSNCLLIDHDAPKYGTVNDGISNDIDYQSGDTVFHANWNGFNDGEHGSGLAEYQYQLTDHTDRNVTLWTSVGLQRNITIIGLSLLNGNTYYLTVRAFDRVGNYKDVKSDGVYIDTTHPVYTGKINIGGETAKMNKETVVYIQDQDSLTASWPQFVDEHSGMKKYQWNISENYKQPTEWEEVPGVKLATKAVFRSLSLKQNIEYRLTIRGINNAGLYADITSPVLIPIGEVLGHGIVTDGHNQSIDIDYLTNTSEVYATWQGFETPDVKIRNYYFAVGSCTRGNYHVTSNNFIPVLPPNVTEFGIKGLHLVNGQRYCVKIKATNLAGFQSEPVSSDGFIVDVTAPELKDAIVLDGSGEDDIDYQSSRIELSATWSGIQDHESGIHHFEVAVSRNRASRPDVTSFVNVGHNTSATITGIRLNNEVYYIILCAINNAALKSCLASDGILIDPTPSSIGVVHDGIIEPDIRYQSSVKKLSANWERIWDLESSVDRFEWGIKEEGGGLVEDFVNVGLQTHVTSKRGLALKHGHSYSSLLRVYNRAGALQELSSNGIIIDTTPPVPSKIKPRLFPPEWTFVEETKTYYSSTASDIHVTWKNFEEPESEMWYYKWAVGVSKYGTQFQRLINIGLTTNANTTGNALNVRPGVLYYVTVVGRNRANLVSANCSWPFLLDYTPPRTGVIHIKSNEGTEKNYFRSDENIHVAWFGFQDSESGIEKHEIYVLQNNTVILNYTLESNQIDLEIFAGLLSPGKYYGILLKSFNYVGLESTVTSTQFTIDNSPPVYTGNEKELPRRRFYSNPHKLSVTWEAFDDPDIAVEYYEVGVGKQAYNDDIYKFTKTDLSTHFRFYELDIKDSQQYYVNINAYNIAGLVRSLSLEKIIFDQSPPTGKKRSVKDGLSREDVDYISPQNTVSASLENIEDLESGISDIEYCVGSTPNNCFVKPFTSIHKNRSFVCKDCKVNAGITVFSRFRVTNGAGLSNIFVSDGVTLDSTSPEIQSVYDGEMAQLPDVEKTRSRWTPTVTWYGARDTQSGLRDCKWSVVKRDANTSLNMYVKILPANIIYNKRRTERAATSLNLTTNASYFNVIQCTNNAGVISYQYSNGWSVVDQWPTPSYVIDGTGPYDMKYDANGESLGASWGAFRGDSKDPVIKYEWAVGTLGKTDNFLEFTEVGLDTTVSIPLSEIDIKLTPGVKYYTTVRAFTLSGWSSNKSSNGFIVDITPPLSGSVKITHRILNQTAKEIDYSLSWKGFADPESGIQSYEYCLGYIRDICSTSVFEAGLAFQAVIHGFFLEDKNTQFYGILIVTNEAGLRTIVSSNAVKIDLTPPLIGRVLDGIDYDFDYINFSLPLATTWSAFTDPESGIKKCTLTVTEKNPNRNGSSTLRLEINANASGSAVHQLPLIPGLQYFSTISCENRDGFISSKSSNGVIVDDSPPIPGTFLDKNDQFYENQYQSSRTKLHVRWTDGYDEESAIMEYLIAVGSRSNEDDIRTFYSVGLAREAKILNLSMNIDSTYYVTLEIVNKAGMRSRVSSNGITIDATPPEITQVKLQRSAINYIGPQDYLSGNWKSYDRESGISFVEYCFGTTSEGCNVQDMLRAPNHEMNVTCLDCKLKHRHTYFMTVRVWNKAGLFNFATSKGVTLDSTAPIGGKVSLSNTYMSCIDNCSIIAEFSGFKDEESGIRSCEFSLKTTKEVTVMPFQPATSKNRIEANDLTLKHEESCKIAVACINSVGERSTEVFSPSIRVDNTPPEKGFVIISPDQNHDARRQHAGCHFYNMTLRVYWSEFYDKESHIAGFRVAIGRKPLESDVIPYTHLGIVSDAKFYLHKEYGLSLGETIYATVEATNRAGLSTKVTSLPSRLISDTDANLVSEVEFECVNVMA